MRKFKAVDKKLVCQNCNHFWSIHGPRGCAAQFCDCKEKKTNG